MGIVVVEEEVGGAVAVVPLSTELEFPVEFARFIGLQVLAIVHSNARSNTKQSPRCWGLPWYPQQRPKINRQTFSLGKA